MTPTYLVNCSEDEGKSELLKFLMNNLDKPISIQNLMQALGLKSPAPVLTRLRHLEQRGKLRRVA